MSRHGPSSKSSVMKGTDLPRLPNAAQQAEVTLEKQEKEAHDRSVEEFQQELERLRKCDSFGDVMDHDPFVEGQTPTQIWGTKASGEKQFIFARWYFMRRTNAIIDTFKDDSGNYTQEVYSEAEVEARRSMAHKYGTRYAALGPKHSRLPQQDPKLRKLYPSLVEQLSEGV